MDTEPIKTLERNALLESLRCQFAVFRDGKPLALGIHRAILARLPGIERSQLRTALRIHTATTRYLKALAEGRERFDLDGTPEGAIDDEQRMFAAQILRQRAAKAVERRRSELQARRTEAVAAQRQRKLEELAARFNKH